MNAQVPIWLDGPTSAVKPSQRIYIKMFHLKYAPALEVREQLNAFATPYVSSLLVFEHANSILITDSLLNLQRIEKLLEQIDRAVSPEDLNMISFFLSAKHIDATALKEGLELHFGKEKSIKGLLRRTPTFSSQPTTSRVFITCHKDDKQILMDYIADMDVPVVIRTSQQLFKLLNAQVEGSKDGGGVREIATITFLSKLEKELDCPLYEKFDYFIGTSAGGKTAMALAAQNLNSNGLHELWSEKNLEKRLAKAIP